MERDAVRASEIKQDVSYAVVGKGIAHARVLVTAIRRDSMTRSQFFECVVEEGLVYTGWEKNQNGHLDMVYADKDGLVFLAARDFLRPWSEEEARRAERTEARQSIAEVMSEMDAALLSLGLSHSLVQLVQTVNGPVAVTVLGIEELKAIQDLIEQRHEQNGESNE